MDEIPFGKIKRQSISQQIYKKLKDRILDGDLPPGTHLLENKIAEQAGISRGPIREALRYLEADGLVEVRANIGTFVHTLTTEEITEIYTVRSLLEGYTTKLAAEKATRLGVEKLRRIMQAAQKSAKNGDLKETIKHDFDLHRQIWEMADHQILYDLLHHLEVELRLVLVAAPERLVHLPLEFAYGIKKPQEIRDFGHFKFRIARDFLGFDCGKHDLRLRILLVYVGELAGEVNSIRGKGLEGFFCVLKVPFRGLHVVCVHRLDCVRA